MINRRTYPSNIDYFSNPSQAKVSRKNPILGRRHAWIVLVKEPSDVDLRLIDKGADCCNAALSYRGSNYRARYSRNYLKTRLEAVQPGCGPAETGRIKGLYH